MEQAADALAKADVAVGEAKQVQASMGALPSEPARPDIAPGTNDADAVRQQRTYSTQLGGYHAAMADREAKAEAAANEMDRVYRDSTATMKQVHGEPDARSGGGSGSGGRRRSSHHGRLVVRWNRRDQHARRHQHLPGWPADLRDPAATGTPHVVAPPGATPPVITAPGTAQDGTILPPMTSTPATVGATGSAPAASATGAGAAGGLAGALGGGLLGGAAGIGGAVRGGGTSVPGSTASAGRSIGSSARTATAGALGRGGATAAGSTAGASRTGAASSATRAASRRRDRTRGRCHRRHRSRGRTWRLGIRRSRGRPRLRGCGKDGDQARAGRRGDGDRSRWTPA